MKGLCLSFHLVSILLVYDKKQLKYEWFSRYIPIFENRIETMHFHKAQTALFLMATLFDIKGTPMNNLANMKIVLGCKVGQIRCKAI